MTTAKRARTTRKPRVKRRAVARPTRSGAAPKLRVGDDAVKKATGRTWPEWADLLDGRGAAGLEHGAITEIVSAYGVGGWWSQMVTVGYEQMRGKRAQHETPRGFQVSASKTVPISAAAAFRHW